MLLHDVKTTLHSSWSAGGTHRVGFLYNLGIEIRSLLRMPNFGLQTMFSRLYFTNSDSNVSGDSQALPFSGCNNNSTLESQEKVMNGL